MTLLTCKSYLLHWGPLAGYASKKAYCMCECVKGVRALNHNYASISSTSENTHYPIRRYTSWLLKGNKTFLADQV